MLNLETVKMQNAIDSFRKDNLQVNTFQNEEEIGIASADFVEQQLDYFINKKGKVNLILATGASQFSFLNELKQKDIEWNKITVFHLDEYKGLSETHPASFRKYLKDRILDIVNPAEVYLINGDAANPDEEINSYEYHLKNNPIDVACIGIGENGHIAFNDPPVADFEDPKWVKEVKLDHDCRTQQLNEGWFASLEEVPDKAITLTIPAIMSSKVISCVVPGERKAQAVKNTINGPVETRCPASILRKHSGAILFLDHMSASAI